MAAKASADGGTITPDVKRTFKTRRPNYGCEHEYKLIIMATIVVLVMVIIIVIIITVNS